MHCISFVRPLNFKILLVFLITNLSPEFAVSINMHVPSSLSRIMMSGLLLGMILSGFACWFHCMVPLFSWLVSTDVICSYLFSLSNFTLISLHMVAHTVSCLCMYCSVPVHIGHADTLWYVVSSYCWHSLHFLSLSVCDIYILHDIWFVLFLSSSSSLLLLLLLSFSSLVTGLFFLVLLWDQRWCPRVRLQVSDCGTCCITVAHPGILFGGGSTNSVEDRTERMRICEGSPP